MMGPDAKPVIKNLFFKGQEAAKITHSYNLFKVIISLTLTLNLKVALSNFLTNIKIFSQSL